MIPAVTALLYLAERKIAAAIERGEFDDLPGAGQPLDLDDLDPLMPEELRMAYRILKNAGMNTTDSEDDSAERARTRKKLLRYFALASCSEMDFFRSLYSLQPKKQSLSSAESSSLALATLPTLR